MPLRGRAFLPMWWSVVESARRDFDGWHTYEHMPERLGVPGFLRGRRYIQQPAGEREVFQIYEAAHIETFRSPGYLARLNAPTDWSNRVQPNMTGIIRGACQTLISLGEGIGGAVATLRSTAERGKREVTGSALVDVAAAMMRVHGVTSVHVGRHEPDVTKLETAETRLRPPTPPSEYDFAILAEGIGATELEAALPELRRLATVKGSTVTDIAVYRLAYLLDDEG